MKQSLNKFDSKAVKAGENKILNGLAPLSSRFKNRELDNCYGWLLRILLIIAISGFIFIDFIFAAPFVGATDNLTFPAGVPTIEIMPSEGPVGTHVFVRIINHQVNKQVIIVFGTGTTIGSSTIVAAKATTDSTGYAVVDFDIDIWPAGRYTLLSDDGVNKIAGGFKVTPSMSLGEVVSGFVGDIAVVNGQGFAAKKLVHLYFDDTKYVTGETDDKGRFYDLKLTIPPCPRGNHNIKAQDSDSNAQTVVYNVRQKMDISPTSTSVNSSVTLIGTGFQSIKDVIIYFDDKEISSVQTGSDGGFTASIKVPSCGDGVHKIKVDDRVNKAFQDLTVSSALHVNPQTGHIGMLVGAQGSGYRPGFPVSLSYDNIKLEGTSVDGTGSFTYNFKIPVSRSGAHVITASDGINIKTVNFTVESTPPMVPLLNLPADGGRITKDPHFEWSPVSDPSGVTYTLEIADDTKFSSIIMSQANIVTSYIDITEESKMLPGSEKPYYWRVKAVDLASNESGWSSVQSFYKGHTIFTVLSNMPDWVKWILIGLGMLLFAFMFFWIGHTIRKLRSINEDIEDDDEEAYDDKDYGYNTSSSNYARR
ncbi:MAG: hypothetical protein PHO26_04595 [Dehalococcoidia bacterium]|nr:hypothetical protein [Dehalococcoidia bacterium]MDD5494888.1 hypothetical protein [Dehalococcoidia bacterium]